MKADLHPAETRRLTALRDYDIFDTPPEAEFDEVTRVLSLVCETPIALISLVGESRQWFKAEMGLGIRETPRESSICAHAILHPGLFIVPDMQADPRFANNPLVTGRPYARFYAGARIESPDGLPLGTVCVLDTRPRELDGKQQALLGLMAAQVMKTLDLRRALTHMRSLAEENAMLMHEVDHRVKNSLQVVTSLLRLQSRRAVGEEAKTQLIAAQRRVMAVANVHTQLHQSGKVDRIRVDTFLHDLCRSLRETAPPEIAEVTTRSDPGLLPSELASTLGLMVAELVANAFKHAYGKDQRGDVDVSLERHDAEWVLSVSDTGVGLPADFEPTRTDGLGMRVVQALAGRLNGQIEAGTRNGTTRFAVRFPAVDSV